MLSSATLGFRNPVVLSVEWKQAPPMKRQTSSKSMEPSKLGGEVRRVHVVYILCRDGKVEQPHLIRVHHLHRHGVLLRDVKRWLAELRGKDMPESFAWSYKRVYKSGYIWQDLMDDDLITPISDNEYLLKGSLLPHEHNHPLFETISCNGTTPKHDDTVLKQAEVGEEQELPPTKTPPEILQHDHEAPPPTLDALTKQTTLFKTNSWAHPEPEQKRVQGEKKQSRARRTHMFSNILWCKAADAKDSVLLPVHRRERDHHLPGSEVSFRSWSHNGSTNSRSMNGGRSSRKAGEKPVREPNCSQCGKTFKPEKLHSHMKSCKALKGSRRES